MEAALLGGEDQGGDSGKVWAVEDRDIQRGLHRLAAALHRKRAAEHDLAAACLSTADSLDAFARAFTAGIAPYEAERAAAHFEGRVPPSLEVYVAEDE